MTSSDEGSPTLESLLDQLRGHSPSPEFASTMISVIRLLERRFESRLQSECLRLETQLSELKSEFSQTQAELAHLRKSPSRPATIPAPVTATPSDDDIEVLPRGVHAPLRPPSHSDGLWVPEFGGIVLTNLPAGTRAVDVFRFFDSLHGCDDFLKGEVAMGPHNVAFVAFRDPAIAKKAVRTLDGAIFQSESEEEDGEEVEMTRLVVYPDCGAKEDPVLSIVVEGLPGGWQILELKEAIGSEYRLLIWRIDRVLGSPRRAIVYFTTAEAAASVVDEGTIDFGGGTSTVVVATVYPADQAPAPGEIESKPLKSVSVGKPEKVSLRLEFASQLRQLAEMGFVDENQNIELLRSNSGSVERCLSTLL